ncbi:MAG: hypothetical protein O3B37_09820, partial [Proteobacteria bacterium]|nr:hypothetical protein [Pseudomonadota bacterium]
TRLFEALGNALSDIPPDQVAGAILITDGQVHDVPDSLAQVGLRAPLHVLLSGTRDDGDRRLVIEEAPSYGIVGTDLEIAVRIEETGQPQVGNAAARVTVRLDGGEPQFHRVPVGETSRLPLKLDHGGLTIIEIEVDPAPEELTLQNNRAAVSVSGVRDRLRVLLVSGEPHAGERTWRNLLKADPSVDLVHFTILRPPEKQDGTPVRELSLIAFPYRELFEVKLNDFDLIIFDRYRRMGVLPSIYLRNIADYVQAGGALLEATGPEITPATSLYRTALASVLPGEPTGDVTEAPYVASVNETGRRHPVTATLPGLGLDADATPDWGRWFRHVDARPKSGTVVMDGPDGRPLLILDRVGEGRVGQFLSDHIWLWARGYEGGGPHNELLRRLAHWLMKEPELEEDRLTAQARGDSVEIVRHSLAPDPAPVTVTGPTGETRSVTLEEQGDGRAIGSIAVNETGIYRLDDGSRTAVAGVGTINPIEFADVTATDLLLRPVAAVTGGGVNWIGESGVADLRRARPGRAMSDSAAQQTSARWLAFQRNDASAVTGVRALPFLPALILLLAIGAFLMAAWRREGK